MLFLTFSVCILPAYPKKILYTVGSPGRGLLNEQGKNNGCQQYRVQDCMLYGHTYSKSMDQPGKVDSPACDQLNRENEYPPVRVVRT